MHRSSLVIAVVVLLACAAPSSGAQLPSPSATSGPKASKRVPGLTNKIHVPKGSSAVSSAACNRRAVSPNSAQGTLGSNGASTSKTLVAVPIGGGSVASATQQQQINEACAHVRH